MEPTLGAFVAALAVSLVACFVALRLFPTFRSGEHKEGYFRPDQSTGSLRAVKPGKGMGRGKVRVSPSELPLVGGPAMLIAVLAASIGAGLTLGLDLEAWAMLAIPLLAMVGYGLVGLADDWMKYWRGEGISERQKGAGVMFVSLAAAIALNRRIVVGPLSARLPYPPYSDFPWLGHILVDTHFAWIIFFLIMTVVVGSATSLATDFTDGMDGLCGGLLVSASLAFAVIMLNQDKGYLQPLIIISLAVAGASLGYLPFNWPSSWKARGQGRGQRRARLIMGDTGSLALGGVLAMVAVISRLEPLLLIIGGVFVLEGVSAVINARILVRFFRMFLVLERYNSSKGFPHSEFPLPFLGTPMHHHFDLLSWDRQRLVYGTWLLGAVLGVLGIASAEAQFTWERYLARFAGLVVILGVWQSGPRTRNFFIGLTAPNAGRRYLALYYGMPYRLFGRPLYGCIDTTVVTPEDMETPVDDLLLWQRLSVSDARSMLGWYCYHAGAYKDALRIWERVPAANMHMRPQIEALLPEVRHTIALASEEFRPGSAIGELAPAGVPAESGSRHMGGSMVDDPSASHWRMPAPAPASSNGSLYPPRLEPAAMDPAHYESATRPDGANTLLWTAASWAGATGENGTFDETQPRTPRAMPPANANSLEHESTD